MIAIIATIAAAAAALLLDLARVITSDRPHVEVDTAAPSVGRLAVPLAFPVSPAWPADRKAERERRAARVHAEMEAVRAQLVSA